MFDINTNEGVNAMFKSILDMDIETAGRRNMAQNFGRTFWAQLSEENRSLYKWMFTIKTLPDNDFDEKAHLEGEAAYDFGMAKQDQEMMDY